MNIKEEDLHEYLNEIYQLHSCKGMSATKINKYYRQKGIAISIMRISKILKDKGFVLGNERYVLTEKDEKRILHLYSVENKKISEILTEFNTVSRRHIFKLLKDNNIEIDLRRSSRIQKINENYFDVIDTESKAYLLGYIIADGCVGNYGNLFRLSLCLNKKDVHIVEFLDKQLNGNGKIYCSKRNEVTVTYGSKILCEGLAKHGVVPRKTHKVYLPIVPLEMYRHLIRGVFDGDGTVFTREDFSKKHNIRLEFGFVGTKALLSGIKEKLIQDINISDNKIVDRGIKYNVHQLCFSKLADIKSFSDYLYKDATICLERKRDKFFAFINLCDNTEVTCRNTNV